MILANNAGFCLRLRLAEDYLTWEELSYAFRVNLGEHGDICCLSADEKAGIIQILLSELMF